MDRFLRGRLTRSITFHNQSPTTAASRSPSPTIPTTPYSQFSTTRTISFAYTPLSLGLRTTHTPTAAAPPRKSQAASLCHLYLSFVILTPLFPPHLTPRRSFCPILPRRRARSARSLSPLLEPIEPSSPRATDFPTPRGLDNDEPVQEHFHVVPDSLTLNVHDLSAYTSQTPHALAPFFFGHRLGDYDPTTDTILHLVRMLHPSSRSDQIIYKKQRLHSLPCQQ